jgi:hypothetical protein
MSDNNLEYIGGAENETNYAGFPPIYEVIIKGETNKRSFMNDISIMNVHNILNTRKNIPFLPMRPRGSIKNNKVEYNKFIKN